MITDTTTLENMDAQALRSLARQLLETVGAQSTTLDERAAAIMSLVQSAKLNGLDPYAYMVDVLTRLPTHPNKRIQELSPQNWKQQAQPRSNEFNMTTAADAAGVNMGFATRLPFAEAAGL